MTVGQVVKPLVSGATFRRGIHLVLGATILLPYVMLAVGFWQMFLDPTTPVVPVGILVVVSIAIGTAPPFLPAMRSLEITAARALLDIDLPDPEPQPSWPARARAAAWYVLHLVSGGVAALTVLFCVPGAVLILTREIAGRSTWTDVGGRLFDWATGFWVVPVGLGMMLGAVFVVFGLGAAMAAVAPGLLGPSESERVKALEAEAQRLGERNRLARELHDSVGHALTVTTLQAAAAQRVIDTDPDFARRAMSAIEDAGRAAMDDLDHVLGLLRADVPGPAGGGTGGPPAREAAPQRTLADLDRLVGETRAAGVSLDVERVGDVATVPAAVSREAYRIVQESLTNALRHAGPVPVSLHVAVAATGLDITVTNTVAEPSTRPRARSNGRGLPGMRERVGILRGSLSAGAEDGVWTVRAHLPVRSSPDKGDSR